MELLLWVTDSRGCAPYHGCTSVRVHGDDCIGMRDILILPSISTLTSVLS